MKHVVGAKVVVEIGCYEGKTTAALGSRTDGLVYSIDPFFKGRLGICYGEFIARSHCRRRRLSNVRFVKGFSHQAAPGFDSEIDFLFLDADHSFEATKRDWDDWFPKVKNGAIIAMHDCRRAPNSPDYLGSMKFFEEYVSTATCVKEIDAVDSLAVLRVTR
jgi:predicted O-methyltransferase YrrM